MKRVSLRELATGSAARAESDRDDVQLCDASKNQRSTRGRLAGIVRIKWCWRFSSEKRGGRSAARQHDLSRVEARPMERWWQAI